MAIEQVDNSHLLLLNGGLMDFIKKYKIQIVSIGVAILAMIGLEIEGDVLSKLIDIIINSF